METEGRPRLRYWLDRLSTDGILAHAAVVYGYFPAVSEGDDVVVLTEPRPDAAERFRFTFPRQQRGRFLCIADFVRSRGVATERGQVDVLPFQLVTMGQPIADFANELFAVGLLPGLPRGPRHRRATHRGARRVLAPAGSRGTDVPRSRDVRRRSRLGGGLLQARLPRGPVLVRLRRLPEPRGPREDGGVAGTRADRRDALRGTAATPRAVHRRVRVASPRGQVLQRLETSSLSGTHPRFRPPTAPPISPVCRSGRRPADWPAAAGRPRPAARRGTTAHRGP